MSQEAVTATKIGKRVFARDAGENPVIGSWWVLRHISDAHRHHAGHLGPSAPSTVTTDRMIAFRDNIAFRDSITHLLCVTYLSHRGEVLPKPYRTCYVIFFSLIEMSGFPLGLSNPGFSGGIRHSFFSFFLVFLSYYIYRQFLPNGGTSSSRWEDLVTPNGRNLLRPLGGIRNMSHFYNIVVLLCRSGLLGT